MNASDTTIVAVAGAGGDLGRRIVKALVARGARVRALVRPDRTPEATALMSGLGATIAAADPMDRRALAQSLEDVACVVSALSGLRPVIVDRQTTLLEAAVEAGVGRFIPSDFSEDFTRTAPGRNRNLDLRRDFMARADRAPLRVTSVLNGAFMDILGVEMPIIRRGVHRVLHWRSADQPLDFTTKDNVAAYTAAAALDRSAPRILRIAGDTVSVREIATLLTAMSSAPYKPMGAGGLGALDVLIKLTRLAVPGEGETFPAWQGMQYMRDMFSGAGKLHPLDNHRYPGLRWTSAAEHLSTLTPW